MVFAKPSSPYADDENDLSSVSIGKFKMSHNDTYHCKHETDNDADEDENLLLQWRQATFGSASELRDAAEDCAVSSLNDETPSAT